MAKGKSGSIRMNSLSASDLAAMENHELRLDHAGHRRSVRKGPDGERVPPLVHNPLRMNSLTQAHAEHGKGARINKGAGKVCRHAFVQFPTNLLISARNEQAMLNEAVAFVNKTHGGNAVFWARLDRDEAGRHGVDVFFAPRYQKATKTGSATWISLTKHGKELAVQRFEEKQAEKKNTKTGLFEKLTDEAGKPVMVRCDSQYFQGRAFQDLWFEHLRDQCKLDWVERGTKKVGRDPDRIEVEEYKLQQDREKAQRVAEAESVILAAFRDGSIVKAGKGADGKISLVPSSDMNNEISAYKQLVEHGKYIRPELRELLVGVTEAREQAAAEAQVAVQNAIEISQSAMRAGEITGVQGSEAGWKIDYNPGLDMDRKSFLSRLIEPFISIIAPILAAIREMLDRHEVELSEYAEATRPPSWNWNNGPGM